MAGPALKLETAGGLDAPDHPVGTDAVLVLRANERAWSDDGVVVLMDLGSAVLSAEMALEMLPDDKRGKVLLCEAPFIEGAVAAAVTAKLGATAERGADDARGGPGGAPPPGGGPWAGRGGSTPRSCRLPSVRPTTPMPSSERSTRRSRPRPRTSRSSAPQWPGARGGAR